MSTDKARPNDTDLPSEDRRQEFLWYFVKERSRLYSYIFSLLPSSEDAEDVLQRTSLQLWKKFHLYDQEREFYPWACSFAYNEVRRYWRSAKRQSERGQILFDEELTSRLAEARSATSETEHRRIELLRECLGALKAGDAKLLSHIYFDGKSTADYASKTGVVVGSVYNRLNRIRQRLFECMTRKLEGRSPVRGS